jgi:hypothetical protein
VPSLSILFFIERGIAMKEYSNVRRQWIGFQRLYRCAKQADRSGLDDYIYAMHNLTAGNFEWFNWYLLCHYGTTDLKATDINMSINHKLPKYLRQRVVKMARTKRLAS